MIDMVEFEKKMGPLEEWAHQCHAASYGLLKHGLVTGRVARGWCRGVGGQHSWVVLSLKSRDCFNRRASIVDPTLWSYDPTVEGIWYGTLADGRHHPHGEGMVWNAGKPHHHGDKTLYLSTDAYAQLSRPAREFLDSVGDLDVRGWMEVASLPVQGWPAEEIILAMHNTPGLTAYIPIDRLGMLTDANPGGMYLYQP